MATNTIIAAELDLDTYRGDTLELEVLFFEDPEKTTPLDLTQWDTFKMQIKQSPPVSKVLVELTELEGLDIGIGKITINLTAEQMELPIGNRYYDIQATSSTEVKTLLKGIFNVEQDITI